MSESDEAVGEIQDSREQICIEWQINNYFSWISQKADTVVTSPYFHFANASWFLELWPNGDRDCYTVGWIGITLCKKCFTIEPKLINFTLGIKCLDKSLRGNSGAYLFVNENKCSGFLYLIERNELLRGKHSLVPGGTLTVVCRARLESAVKEVASQTISSECEYTNISSQSVKGVASQTKCSDGVSTLSEDLRNLLLDEKNADVTIKVKDKIFRVHKSIVGSRSSVFSAMFEHDMKESTTGEVNIDDCEPEIFHDFLLFLYSGKVEKLSSDTVEGLYYLANKYMLKDLTSICLDFMKESLDLRNVCGVVALADRHHEEELMKSASEMIKNNLKDLVQTKQWVTFMSEKSDLAAELLKKALLTE